MKVLFFLFLLIPAVGVATTYTVNSTFDAVDTNPGNDACLTAGLVCTLRAAVMESNAHGGTDIIHVPAGTYALNIPGAGEDTSIMGDLDITSTVHLQKIGDGTVLITGNNDRVLHITAAGSATITGVTIKSGNVTG